MKIAVLGTRGFPQIQGGVEAHCENLYPRIEESVAKLHFCYCLACPGNPGIGNSRRQKFSGFPE